MIDPKRWIDDGAPDAVRKLLIAAREERPRRASARRALVALGLGGALSAGAETASGATGNVLGSIAAAKGASGSLALVLKWGLVGAATAAVVGVAGVALRQAPSLPGRSTATAQEGAVRSVAPSVARADEGRTMEGPTPQALAVAPGGQAAAPEVPAPVHEQANPAHRPSRLGVEPSPTGDLAAHEETSVLLEEVAAIDQARAAVARGDATAAISALNAYAARFKPPRFEPEALYLRMEALGVAGDRDGQHRVAERLLTAFPNAPQAARARALLR